MIIVIINAAFLILYLYLILQFLVLPQLRHWVPQLVRASTIGRWRRHGVVPSSLGCSWRSSELAPGDATVADDHAVTQPTTSRRRTMIWFRRLRGTSWRVRGNASHNLPEDTAASTTHTSASRDASCSNVLATVTTTNSVAADTNVSDHASYIVTGANSVVLDC